MQGTVPFVLCHLILIADKPVYTHRCGYSCVLLFRGVAVLFISSYFSLSDQEGRSGGHYQIISEQCYNASGVTIP